VIPGKHDPSRQLRARRQHRLDIEGEALAALEALRQGGDDPDDIDITALPRLRQVVLQALVGEKRRPRETQQCAGEQRYGAIDGILPACLPEQERERGDQRAHDGRPGRQSLLRLQKADTESEGDNTGAHSALDLKTASTMAGRPGVILLG